LRKGAQKDYLSTKKTPLKRWQMISDQVRTREKLGKEKGRRIPTKKKHREKWGRQTAENSGSKKKRKRSYPKETETPPGEYETKQKREPAEKNNWWRRKKKKVGFSKEGCCDKKKRDRHEKVWEHFKKQTEGQMNGKKKNGPADGKGAYKVKKRVLERSRTDNNEG